MIKQIPYLNSCVLYCMFLKLEITLQKCRAQSNGLKVIFVYYYYYYELLNFKNMSYFYINIKTIPIITFPNLLEIFMCNFVTCHTGKFALSVRGSTEIL